MQNIQETKKQIDNHVINCDKLQTKQINVAKYDSIVLIEIKIDYCHTTKNDI